ncbi:Membrane-associated progesterone receptor component 2, partial [Eschrichtius robustus]|nr:Membrane-associated progesterone receptor component 2 [Eschrichtius robustus]
MLLNVALVALVLLGAYRLWVRWGRRGLGAGAGAGEESPAASLPRMKKRDFSLEQLRQYDGSRTPRILLAVNGKVFDVTKGSKFYGPGEEELDGEGEDPLQLKRDHLMIGRPLGKGETNLIAADFLLMYLSEKYDYVGRLLKPGEEPSEYTDEEDTKDHSKQD